MGMGSMRTKDWNQNPDITLADLGICNDSMIICIISKEKGREIEKIIGDENGQYENKRLEPVLECEFLSRPFGFAVWANESGDNAIVTKVAGRRALHLGIQIGYCVYKVNEIVVFNWKHNEVLNCLKTTQCPIRLTFVDLGTEYTVKFEGKPLGFTVVQGKDSNNAKVSKITLMSAVEKGIKIGSYIVAVNDRKVFGLTHKSIVDIINYAVFPIRLRLRHPPKLLLLSRGKRLQKMKRKVLAWASG